MNFSQMLAENAINGIAQSSDFKARTVSAAGSLFGIAIIMTKPSAVPESLSGRGFLNVLARQNRATNAKLWRQFVVFPY